ncbi:MAG: S53 family peptidase, partial [Candidatus Sulfotelmatobacter sp.]
LLLFANPGFAQQALMTHHVRDEVASGRAQFVGQLPASQTLRFDIVLPLRDRAGLQSFVQEVNDPASPSYHQFLTPQEVTARFGPSQEDWDAAVAFAKASGFQIVGGTRDSRDLWLTSTVANVNKAFHVTLGNYHDPVEDRTFFAIDREPTVNLPFQLWHITGLDNDSRPHPMYVKKSDYAKAHGIDSEKVVSHATTGSGPSASFLGSDMRAAYYEGTALTGTGQNLALFEFLGTDLADLNTYYSNVGQTKPYTPTLISTGGYSTTCTESGGCDDTEQTLDMTQAMGMAPGSTMLYMYVCGNASTISDTACISAMVTTTSAPLSKQIGCSWGWTPADPSTLDPYFEQMASQGQNFFAASGDSSAWSASNEAWPADDANIVSVGGTDLTTSSAAGPWHSETAWVDSGGGVSPDSIPIPSWQTPVDGCSGCSKTLRNGPDVSANANFTFYVCADQTTCTANEYGGTSFAAPMWAGYLALANQQAAANGKTIGFINPIIYPAAEGSGYSTDFHDITSGSCGKFSAATGYDLCTGWGSPNTTGLINLLAGSSTPSFTLSASPSSVTITQGGAGGTSTITVTDIGGFSGSVTLAASGLPSGVTAVFGTNPTTSTSVLTLTASATATTGTVTVTISGTSGSLNASTTISLTVNSSGGGGGAQTAVYNSTLKAPECATVGTSCDSGPTLLLGRDHISGGAEPNQPNTINSSCADGTTGTFHSDESNDRIVVTSSSGSLTHGTTATVSATVWAYAGFTSDALDLYYAANANSPSWTFIKTIVPTKAGAQTLSTNFTLPTGSLQAVRAQFRYLGSASSCTTGSYNDHDDLIFAVQ